MTTASVLDADIIIAGAGFAGIGMGIALKKAGMDAFIILEQANDLGGTWRENDYPGCACDIPAMLYSFSFEPSPDWSRVFPSREEIWRYLHRCSVKYGVQPHIRFGSVLLDARYDDPTATWTVRTRQGTLRSRVFIAAMGALDRAYIPDLPGLETFAGTTFHSARWNPAFDVRGKDVAVVGTGASGVQFIPEITPAARRLVVFQRTPPWIMPRPDHPISERRKARRRFAPYAWFERMRIYWALEVRALGFTVDPALLRAFERQALRKLEREVPDPVLREKLTPNYRMGCKRVLLSNDFYAALQRPNVELVTAPIREVRPHSIVDGDGVERTIDALIFATGFRATESPGPVRFFGTGGVELKEAWKNGASAYLGTSIAGFPNLYLLIGPNTGLGHNSMILMIEAQIRYVMSALGYMRANRLAALVVKPDVQHEFNDRLQSQMAHTVWTTGCTSWYLDANGRNTTLWPSFTFAFAFLTRRLRPERYESRPLDASSGMLSSAT